MYLKYKIESDYDVFNYYTRQGNVPKQIALDLFILCVACLTVFVNCLVKQFTIFLGVVVILLLNVMEVLSVDGGDLLDRPCMVFQRVGVLCL